MSHGAREKVRGAHDLYTAWVLIQPADDLPGVWVAHALDFDVVSQGDSVEHAMQMIAEAVSIVLEEDIESGDDPYARRAPDQFWERLYDVMAHGERLPLGEIIERARNAGPTVQCCLAVSMFFRESRQPDAASFPTRTPLALARVTADAHPC